MAHVGGDPAVDDAEKAGNAQVRHHDHHAEQQRDGAEIDRPIGFLNGEHAGAHHQRAAEQRRAGAVDAEDRNLAERDDHIGRDEDGNGRRSGKVGHGGDPVVPLLTENGA